MEIPQHVIYILQNTQIVFANINKYFLDPKPFIQDFADYINQVKTAIVSLPFKDGGHKTHKKPKASHDITCCTSIL